MHRCGLVLGARIVLILVGCLPIAGHATLSTDLGTIRDRLSRLAHEMTHTRHHRQAARQALEAADAALDAEARTMHRLRRQGDRLSRQAAALTDEIERAKARLAGDSDAISRDLEAAYALKRRNGLTILLDQDRPARVRRMLHYYGDLVGAEAADVSAAEAQMVRLTVARARLASVRAELATSADAQRRQGERLRHARSAQAAAVASIDSRLAGERHERQRLKAAEARLEHLVQRLNARVPAVNVPPPPVTATRFGALRGYLRPPVALAAGRAPRAVGDPSAVFFPAAAGSPVRAVFSGVVAYAGWLRGFGLLLILEHRGGYMTVYAHAEGLFRSVGDRVEAGEVVATAGRSGGFRHAGLYFEIRHDGRPVDVWHWLRR